MESDAAVVGMGGETIRFWGDVACSSQCRRHGQGEVGAGPRLAGVQFPRRAAGRSSVSWLFPAAARTAPSAPAFSPAGPERGNRPEFDLVTGVSTGALDRAVRLPWTALRRCAEEGLHRVDHERHCHRAPGEQDCLAGSRSRAMRPSPKWSPFTSTTPSSKRWPPST